MYITADYGVHDISWLNAKISNSKGRIVKRW